MNGGEQMAVDRGPSVAVSVQPKSLWKRFRLRVAKWIAGAPPPPLLNTNRLSEEATASDLLKTDNNTMSFFIIKADNGFILQFYNRDAVKTLGGRRQRLFLVHENDSLVNAISRTIALDRLSEE